MASPLLLCKRRKDACPEPSAITSEPRSINDLPAEILLIILSHFGPEELCLNIAKVCKKWNILSKDMALWKTLSYKCDSSSVISRIEEVLTVAPALNSLSIHERKDVACILGFLFPRHIYLRKLILECCSLGKDGDGLLTNIVALYPDLEFLSLESCRPLSAVGYHSIPHLKKLSELQLADCEGLSGTTVRLIADSCKHLKKLTLDGYGVLDDGDAIHIIKQLGKQLTTLILSGAKLTDVAYLYLRNCARLQELNVFNCEKMTDGGLLDGIGLLHELASLSLTGGHNLTAQALVQFLLRPSMTSIVSLELSECHNLDDEGMKQIAERCTHLKELTVSDSYDVSDAGIGMVTRHCSQLRELNLFDLKGITGEGWLDLVPSHLPHLRELCLVGSDNMFDDYVAELVAARPELKVDR